VKFSVTRCDKIPTISAGDSLRELKCPAGKILVPGVVGYATDLVEYPEL
jgi:hypothetical protein